MGTSSSSAKASSSKPSATKSGSAWLDAVKAVSNSGAAGAAGGAGGGVAGDSSASVTTGAGAGGGAGAAAAAGASSSTTTTAVAATTTTKVAAKEPVKLPPTVERKPSDKLAFTVPALFTAAECACLIALTESEGYTDALVNVGGGVQQKLTDVRSSKRCMVDDAALADWMWERIKCYVPAEKNGLNVVGLNERLRFLRYDGGEFFRPHMDGVYERGIEFGDRAGERSQLTLLLYLNEGYEGARTTFLAEYPGGPESAVEPHTGLIMVQDHDILHEVPPLISGRKYVMRTDIMYAFPPDSKHKAERVEFLQAVANNSDGSLGRVYGSESDVDSD